MQILFLYIYNEINLRPRCHMRRKRSTRCLLLWYALTLTALLLNSLRKISLFLEIDIYADTLKVSSGALIEVTLLFRYSTTDREATRVLALFGHLSEWQFN